MIRVFEPYIFLKDKISVFLAVNSKNISGTSSEVLKFENNLKEYFNREYATTVSNGSNALDVALNLANIKEGDKVIVPSFTIISCLSAILRCGAKPVFCDVDHLSWNMTLENVLKVYSDDVKAILMVHTYGLTAQANEIEEFCVNKNIFLIEDAAEAHGQTYMGRKCGSFGDVSTLSFYANKHITTGEGGAVLTNSEEFYLKTLKMRNLDFDNNKRFKHNNLYWNYRLGGLQAALGSSQIEKIDKVITYKTKQGLMYNKLFDEYKDLVQTPLIENFGSLNHYWVYGIVLKPKKIRDKVMTTLKNNGIETRPFFWPLHLQDIDHPNYEVRDNNLEISEDIGKNGFYIPMGLHINKSKQKYIVEKVIEAIKSNLN